MDSELDASSLTSWKVKCLVIFCWTEKLIRISWDGYAIWINVYNITRCHCNKGRGRLGRQLRNERETSCRITRLLTKLPHECFKGLTDAEQLKEYSSASDKRVIISAKRDLFKLSRAIANEIGNVISHPLLNVNLLQLLLGEFLCIENLN